REARRRNLARKELAWLSRGARARSTKQKFHVKQARELIADVPPLRNTLELKQMATSRLGKQVVDLIDVTQVFAAENGVTVDGTPRPDAVRPAFMGDADTAGAAAIDPDVAEMAASASRVDVVRPMYAEPQAYGAVELAVDDLSTDPRLRDAGVAFTPTVTSDSSAERPDAPSVTGGEPSARSASSGEGATLQDATGEATTLPATSAAHKVSVTGRKVLDDVTWLIGPGDRFGIVGANGAGKSTLLKILDGSITPTAGHVNIGKTVRFAVLSQRLDELEALGKYKVKEVLSRYKPSYIVDGKEVTPGQLMERLGFEAAQLMTPIRDLSGGQKRRMQLLLILLDEPNVLIMDEPGNDLDTDMLAVMEDLLDTWPGTLIVVSHDRYLLERVTDQQFALIGGKIRHLPGGVDDYLAMTEAIKAGRDPFGGDAASIRRKGSAGATGTATPADDAAGIADDAAAPEHGSQSGNGGATGTATVGGTPKLTGKAFHEASKRVSQIERKLAKLEEEKSELETRMAEHDPSDYAGLNEMNVRLQAIAEEAEPLELEWMELSEQLE
ncbi:MAG: ABC-F family ATP-binding cassette domain-containing protein, partial [Bifidobacterium sp.]|nr:ABC-F family ATP-binding cassette domain-containing protein [Bifidobacterium sp.]